MRAGTLRHRITIQKPILATDPFQTEGAGSWENIITMWGSIESAGVRDIYNAGLQNMQVSHLVTIRYPGADYQIGPGYQLLYGTRAFQVLKGIINKDERNIMLQLFVDEINPTA